jgi:hypothetical protein
MFTSGLTQNIIGVSESKSIEEEMHLHGEKLTVNSRYPVNV